ncbi:MAG: hypothetical protein RL514_2074 [Verrucomicrobiota bacterium]|jgi:hypothetical protein
MNPARAPIAGELFAQWQRARGGRTEPAARPFSRDWEDLLEDARLVSATERGEAEHDARALEVDGWLELKPVRYKPHLIARLVIPLAAETRWCEAFGFVQPTDEEARQIREFAWVPELAFLREARVSLPFGELRQLNDFFQTGGRDRELVPIKERSLQLFDDEKRLDVLADSALFRDGRLNLAQVRCEIVPEPLGWKRGPAKATSQPVIVLENAATWHSYVRWNEATCQFSAVIYGGGNRFVEGVSFLAEIFLELGGPRRVFYFGDLDVAGLQIPHRANERARKSGLPPVEPHLWSYHRLFTLSAGLEQAAESESATFCDWLGELAGAARQLFASNQRLAQEHVGWEFLSTQVHD